MASKADLHRHLAHQIELKAQALKRVEELEEALRPFAALDPNKWGAEERTAILAAREALKEPTK